MLLPLLGLSFFSSLRLLSSFDISSRLFYRLMTNASVTHGAGEVTKTLYCASRIPCAKECNRLGASCSGFEFDPVPDGFGNHKCDTVQFLTHDRVASGSDSSSELFIARDVSCFRNEDCNGPFGPVCENNQCVLKCNQYQTQTSDGNCTLEIPSAWSVGPVQRLLRWYESIVSEMKGIQLDSTCLPSDECGILFSTEKPSRRMHDFWPEGANKWPQHQVLALYKSPDMLSVSYLEVNDLTRTVVESGEITLADIGVSPPITIGAEVEPFDGGVRKVTIKVQLADGTYQTVGGPFSVRTSAALEDDKYFFATVHKAFGKSFTFRGSVNLKDGLNYIEDPDPDTPCEAGETKLEIEWTKVPTCVKMGTQKGVADSTNIKWFQLDQAANKNGFVFTVQATGTDDSIGLVLSKRGVLQWDAGYPSRWIRLIITKTGEKTASINFKKKYACQEISPDDCPYSPILIANRDISETPLFDGSEHEIEIEYTYITAASADRHICSFTKDKMLTYKYTWVLYVDGAKVMEVQDLYTFLCYKLVSNSGFVRYMSESGIHGNIETFGLLGGFKYEHTGLATPVLEDDLT